MIDLKKEVEVFEEYMKKHSSYVEIRRVRNGDLGEYMAFDMNLAFQAWEKRAQIAHSQLGAKNNAIIFADECRQEWYELAMRKDKALQEANAQLAQYQSDDYVLVPKKPTNTMIDAVRAEHEGAPYLPYSIYETFIKQAMIEAQEQDNAKP